MSKKEEEPVEEKEIADYEDVFDRPSGITFTFKRDSINTRILHIATHFNAENRPMCPEDAICIFLYGNEKPPIVRWNKTVSVTTLGDESIWWYWKNKETKNVMIITCFDKNKG